MPTLDSSALIALLRREPGGTEVRRLLRERRGDCVAHAINLGEVYTYFARWFDEHAADRALDILDAAGILSREDLDPALRREASLLIADARRTGRGLALGDAFGLALARRLGDEFVTAEHGELDRIAAAGVYSIRFIR